jgi:replication factor C subunit 1
VLESLERDECKNLIEKYGGRVTVAISGKTNFLLAGRDVSESKITKAKELKLKVISEDDLLEMIRTRPGDDATPKKQTVTAKPKGEPSTPVKTTSESNATTAVPKPTVDQSGLLCELHMCRSTRHFLRA